MTYRNQTSGGYNGITGLIFLIFTLVALYYVSVFVFKILYFVAPFLFLAALWLDYKGVISFGKWLISLVKKNPLVGIGAILIGIIAYPVVALFLFGKALVKKKVKEVTQQFEERAGANTNRTTQTEEFTDYEEVEFEDLDLKEPKLTLPPMPPKAKNTNKNNEYDSFFE